MENVTKLSDQQIIMNQLERMLADGRRLCKSSDNLDDVNVVIGQWEMFEHAVLSVLRGLRKQHGLPDKLSDDADDDDPIGETNFLCARALVQLALYLIGKANDDYDKDFATMLADLLSWYWEHDDRQLETEA